MTETTSNYLTIDVEDYYQVAAFENIVETDSWGRYESRVVTNTKRILTYLERYQVKATFFIVGWIAENYPDLIRQLHAKGHEIGCHSYLHQKIYTLSPDEFREDTRKSKCILEDIIGAKVNGYRAPSYSITKRSLWALDILEELGFTYDSSIFPIMHDNYGIPDAPRFKYQLPGHQLTEYPPSTALICGQKVPVAGGGYFRLFPYWFTKMALRKINKKEGAPFVFYLHPWEFDPDQPYFPNASALSRFRHYNNLKKTASRFEKLLSDFAFRPILPQGSTQAC